MTPMLYPVYSYGSGERTTVAIFTDWSAAVDFINHPEQGFETRECYLASPKYDRRVEKIVERDLRRTMEIQRRDKAA